MTTQTQQGSNGDGGAGGQVAQGQAAPAAAGQPAAPAAPAAAAAPAPAPAMVPLAQVDELKASNLRLQESLEQSNKRWETLQGFFKNPDGAPAELPAQAAAAVAQASSERDMAYRALRATQLAVGEDAHDPAVVAQVMGNSKAFAVDAQGNLKDATAARAELATWKARNPWAFRQAAAPAAAAPAAPAAGGAVTPAPGMIPAAAPPAGVTPPAANQAEIRNAGFMPMSALRAAVKQ